MYIVLSSFCSSLFLYVRELHGTGAAEQAAVEKLADTADHAERSWQEYTQLRERGTSESELAYLWRKVVDHQAKEQKAKDELTEAVFTSSNRIIGNGRGGRALDESC